jgi:hypothetical protein
MDMAAKIELLRQTPSLGACGRPPGVGCRLAGTPLSSGRRDLSEGRHVRGPRHRIVALDLMIGETPSDRGRR